MSSNDYESDALLAQYLLFHYGDKAETLPDSAPAGQEAALGFAVRTVRDPLDPTMPRQRALDLGCAVGRSSFELSTFCDEVVGIDLSASFIGAAETLRTRGELPYRRHDEGHLSTELVARRPAAAEPARVRFEVGDACALRGDLGDFDLVHAANLLCRLPEPEALLRRLPDLVRPGGELVLATPCTWLAEFTPPDRWPDGKTLDWLEGHLAPAFRREWVGEIPFLIREHARKFQWSRSQTSRWRRVASG